MFEIIKSSVNLLEQIANDTQQAIVECGTDTYKFEEDEEVGCFFCGHKGCLKLFYKEDEPEKAGYHCFSCEAHGDVIGWTIEFAKSKNEELNARDACLKLAKEHDIKLPSGYNPVAEIFQLAANYYQTCFWEECNKPYMELAKLTPLEYQKTVRGHSEEVLKSECVGWSDGGVVAYLEALGFDEEILDASGLRSQKTGRDFLPSRVFIYPHYVKGKVSHFTFKDPLKKLAYQLPNKYSMNGHEFWGQDTVNKSDTVYIVEGENDRLSLLDVGKTAVLATIGQISGSQADWLRENLSDKHIVTFFDNDKAGGKYREKLEKIRKFFKNLTQVVPGVEDDDIDKLIHEGANVDEIVAACKAADSQNVSIESGTTKVPFDVDEALERMRTADGEADSGNRGSEVSGRDSGDSEQDVDIEILPPGKDLSQNSVVQKKGAYWRVTFKDGEPQYNKISDFVIVLKNIYITEDGDRHREVVIIREDGQKSNPMLIDSETKVSLKPFRTLLARAVDADFKGNERDMSGVWDLVYSQSAETQVRVTRTVGRHEGMRGWIFRNKFISDTGAVIDPDKDGVFWLAGKTVGIRPESLNVASNQPSTNGDNTGKVDIPFIDPDVSRDDADELMKGIVANLSKNLNSPGQALTILGWMYACIYSNTIFSLNKSFPFLFLWGTKGKGKTSIAKWVQDFYDMRDCGYTSVSQLRSAVGWGRKVEYYSSLPVFIDEIRADKETGEYLSLFRSYFDRAPRTMGVKDGFGVKTQEVRSCFIFVGEDLFDDPAARERCIPVRIPVNNRELTDSYRWLEDHRHLFSGMTYRWILEAADDDREKLKEEIRELDKELVREAKCSQRVSKNWAAIGVFAQRLAEKYLPEFDFKKYLFEASTEEASNQKSDTTVMQFFEHVEAMQAGEFPKITHQHIMADSNLVHIWFPAVYKAVIDDSRGKFPFSKNAVISAIREEPYFVADDRKVKMGLNGARRIVLTLDMDKAPDAIKNIGNYND
jgi:5S rRNA maturation endonuclease (ribonuclease M5)